MDFLVILGCNTGLYHSQGGPSAILCALWYDCNKGVLFYPKFNNSSRLSHRNSVRPSVCYLIVSLEENRELLST